MDLDLIERHCPREIGEPCYACGPEREDDTPHAGACEIAALAAQHESLAMEVAQTHGELARLRTGIERFLSGDYPHPRAFPFRVTGVCPHGTDYWQECDECNTAFLQGLLEGKGDE